VRTDREVTIVEERRMLSGRGMEYNNQSLQFQLLSEVRGLFEPKVP
jgi:lipopolysaccharide export system protein LptC